MLGDLQIYGYIFSVFFSCCRMELQSPAEKAPKFPGDAQESNVPALFTKLHRRSGERAGLYLAETKNRFVVSDGQWEVLAVWAVVITFAVIVLFMILGKATSEVALIIVAGCLTPCLLVEVLFMRRLTTTLDRRRRRMIQDTTRWCCVTRRNEFDLDDVVKLAKKGLGRQAIIEAHLSSGETVPLTYASIFKSQDDLKVTKNDKKKKKKKKGKENLTKFSDEWA
jgi:hypothetical protein